MITLFLTLAAVGCVVTLRRKFFAEISRCITIETLHEKQKVSYIDILIMYQVSGSLNEPDPNATFLSNVH